MYYWISLEGYQTICVRSFHLQRANKISKVSGQYTVRMDHPTITSVDLELKNYPKSSIYLYNYQRETAIFQAAKHEKTIMACSYLISSNFSFILNFWLAIP